MKSNILFILHLPPPVHGAAMMGQYIKDSKVINETFDCHYINLTTANNLTDIGKFKWSKISSFYRLLKNIRQEIKRLRPQLVYITPNSCGKPFYKDFIVVQMVKRMGCNVVVHYHNKGVARCQNKWLDNALYRRFFRNLKVILLSERLFDDVKKYVKREDVLVCPNGIPQQSIHHEARQDSEFNILFLSNMMKEKGVWDMLDACQILKSSGKQFKCHFVGKWSDISEDDFNAAISNNVRDLNDQVVAYGGVYGEEKEMFWSKADLFVLPTHNECFPLVLLEAMQHGISCVATDEGAIADIIENGKTGFIVPKNNPQALAEKIAYMIDNPQQCQAMGKAGLQKYQAKLTQEKFENNMKEILNACLN